MARKAITRNVVISFRVVAEIEGELTRIITENPKGIMGVKSTRTLARRIVIDFARGRLAYKNPEDFRVDREIMAQAKAEEKALATTPDGETPQTKAPKAKAKTAKQDKLSTKPAKVMSTKAPRRKSS